MTNEDGFSHHGPPHGRGQRPTRPAAGRRTSGSLSPNEPQHLAFATEITVTPTDELIFNKAIKVVEDNMIDEVFDVEKFAELMGMSRSTLNRKIKAVTGLSPLAFMQKLRLKRAAHLLTTSDLTVSEIAARDGFYDLSYFGKLFKKESGVPPSTYGGHHQPTNARRAFFEDSYSKLATHRLR